MHIFKQKLAGVPSNEDAIIVQKIKKEKKNMTENVCIYYKEEQIMVTKIVHKSMST